jgi:hypothetical protein
MSRSVTFCQPVPAHPFGLQVDKSQLTAFFLSFFLGIWGADRFYLGWLAAAIIKLILTLLFCVVNIVVRCLISSDDESKGAVLASVSWRSLSSSIRAVEGGDHLHVCVCHEFVVAH